MKIASNGWKPTHYASSTAKKSDHATYAGTGAAIAGLPVRRLPSPFFSLLCELLDKADIPYTINPRLVRGLDYYTRTVFEWVTDELGSQGYCLRRRPLRRLGGSYSIRRRCQPAVLPSVSNACCYSFRPSARKIIRCGIFTLTWSLPVNVRDDGLRAQMLAELLRQRIEKVKRDGGLQRQQT